MCHSLETWDGELHTKIETCKLWQTKCLKSGPVDASQIKPPPPENSSWGVECQISAGDFCMLRRGWGRERQMSLEKGWGV